MYEPYQYGTVLGVKELTNKHKATTQQCPGNNPPNRIGNIRTTLNIYIYTMHSIKYGIT